MQRWLEHTQRTPTEIYAEAVGAEEGKKVCYLSKAAQTVRYSESLIMQAYTEACNAGLCAMDAFHMRQKPTPLKPLHPAEA